jgi:UrcA family protein
MTIQTSSRCRPFASLVFLLSTLVCLPAFADEQPKNQEPSMKVAYADLDLNTDAGRRVLLQRLSRAAHRVCTEDANQHNDVGHPMVFGSWCYQHTLAAAVDRFHQAQLSALFAAASRQDKQ